ncbi:hypothetical protein MYP_1750 [Sporocytophaga myxococcoides]|uniref:Uncharacterized protein n=1 Tax=Sporocytophaga myxococcoides TaxID=153721 RepID=A0A098LDK1_9BACT|nr:hypothetical protein MYP_1750 [Sporocytophaga myxococcoides]
MTDAFASSEGISFSVTRSPANFLINYFQLKLIGGFIHWIALGGMNNPHLYYKPV